MKIKPVKILDVYFLRKLSAMKSDILSLYLPKVQVQSQTIMAHKTVLVRLPAGLVLVDRSSEPYIKRLGYGSDIQGPWFVKTNS